jgi:spermidine synthase
MVFFFPKTIDTQTSQINGEIKVIKFFGTYRIVSGGFTQSGGLIRAIWKKVLKRIKTEKNISKPNILILGFGAGSAAQVIHKLWPNAKITGLELDPVMIKLAKKYFKINSIPDLTIINQDAIKWVNKKAKGKSKKFDLILVDLYIGGELPIESTDIIFLKAVKDLLTRNGSAIFNRLIKAGEKKNFKEFREKLNEDFTSVNKIPTPANAVFATYK